VRGSGLESLTKSVWKQILQNCRVQNAQNYEEISRGYGPNDIDLVCTSKDGKSIVCFSCKVNSNAHNVLFFNNIETHFGSTKPGLITVILCSSGPSSSSVFGRFLEERKLENFSWSPTLNIETIDLSVFIPNLAQKLSEKVIHGSQQWPYLIRQYVFNNFQNYQHRIVHICGRRRVGKTTMVKSLNNTVYINLKEL